jgi:hypothetical protein
MLKYIRNKYHIELLQVFLQKFFYVQENTINLDKGSFLVHNYFICIILLVSILKLNFDIFFSSYLYKFDIVIIMQEIFNIKN